MGGDNDTKTDPYGGYYDPYVDSYSYGGKYDPYMDPYGDNQYGATTYAEDHHGKDPTYDTSKYDAYNTLDEDDDDDYYGYSNYYDDDDDDYYGYNTYYDDDDDDYYGGLSSMCPTGLYFDPASGSCTTGGYGGGYDPNDPQYGSYYDYVLSQA